MVPGLDQQRLHPQTCPHKASLSQPHCFSPEERQQKALLAQADMVPVPRGRSPSPIGFGPRSWRCNPGWEDSFLPSRNADSPRILVFQPLWSSETSQRRNRRSPHGTDHPLSPATPSSGQDGDLAPTVLSQPGPGRAGLVVRGQRGKRPVVRGRRGAGASPEEHGGGKAQAHSSFLKGLLLLREEAANGEDKAEVR